LNPQEAANPVQLVGIESMAANQPERLQPELARLVFPLDMNVWWFAAIEAREETDTGQKCL
jgi:hypothetical protein